MWALLSVSSDPAITLSQYGLAGLCIVVESSVILVLWRSSQKKDETIATLNEDRVERERHLSTDVLPVLTETARVMSTVPDAIDRALEHVADSSRAERVEALIARLERAARSVSPEA